MRTVLALFLVPLSLMGLIAVLIGAFFLTLPDVTEMNGCMVTSMYQVKLCPKEGNYTPYDQISPHVINAIVASEDASFFHHGGFDWHELRESFTTNLRERTYKRGGSTITQQLAKNVFLAPEKSLLRKLREAAITVDIERRFSKKQILEKYLNVVEFGPGIYGVKAAARHYFGKHPGDLHVLEASYLAYLLPNPKGYSSTFRNGALTPFARKMLTVILRRLEGFRKISPEAATAAISRIDEFPWASVAASDFDSSVPASDAPSSSEVIENFLKNEDQVDVSPEDAASAAAEPEAPAPGTEEPETAEDPTTWD